MTPAGLEPAIPGSVDRCLIHWATGPWVCKSRSINPSFQCERLGHGSNKFWWLPELGYIPDTWLMQLNVKCLHLSCRATEHTPAKCQSFCGICRDPGSSRGPSDLLFDALPTELSWPCFSWTELGISKLIYTRAAQTNDTLHQKVHTLARQAPSEMFLPRSRRFL